MDITAAHVERVARWLFGSAGPSGTSSEQWRAFLLRYGSASGRLREASAASTHQHTNKVVPWNDMIAFVAQRSIALSKMAVACPIGIRDSFQWIEAKAMALRTGLDVQDPCGINQFWAWAKAGIEAAVHAMWELFTAEESEGLLLVDTSNAFNALNRPAAFWNCQVLWPRCSWFLFNSCWGYAVFLLKSLSSGKLLVLLSQDGTIQGCPLAMLMYTVWVLLLISHLRDRKKH